MMKKLITLILVFTAVLTLVSCNKPSDGEILTEYKALYEKAREVNKMIYGEGLPYDGEYDVSSLASPVYVTVSESCPYKTLEDIKTAVLSGKYPAGEQIPSVRQLAQEAAVNPNTVQHAFTELENEGVIISQGTLGRFVTDNAEIIERCRKEMAQKIVRNFLSDLNALSIDKEQAIKLIKEAIL